MKTLLTATLCACLGLLTACEPAPEVTTGTTELTRASRVRNGDIAPVLPVKTRDGRLVELSETAEPIMVVAFVDVQGDCGFVSPDLRNLAGKLNLDGVTVVQISEGCNDCPQLIEKVRVEKDNFMVLCDGKQIARKAFLSPAVGSVYVIDQHDRIVYESNIDDLPRVEREAERVNDQYEAYLEDVLRSDQN